MTGVPIKYRKKPVVIEAMQVVGPIHDNGKSLTNAMEWISAFGGDAFFEGDFLTIKTLEGTMTVSWDDYVIRGVQGEFYPCKPDIFLASYEEVLAPRTIENPVLIEYGPSIDAPVIPGEAPPLFPSSLFNPRNQGCDKAPAGWWCSRYPDHDGPCAARPIKESQEYDKARAMDMLAFRVVGQMEDYDPTAVLDLTVKQFRTLWKINRRKGKKKRK